MRQLALSMVWRKIWVTTTRIRPQNQRLTLPAAAHLLHQKPAQSPAAEPDPERLPESERLWDVRKAAADDVAALYAQAPAETVAKHAAKVSACSQTVILTDVINRETGEIGRKAESWKCRERHCPICQSARARKLHRAFSAALPAIMAEVPQGAFCC